MIYTDSTKKAMKLIFEKHQNQFDRAGIPYVNHPLHVAESMPDEDSTCVALMHDLIEDTNTTLDDIKAMGFNQKIIETLETLTHDHNEDYYKYVAKLSSNPMAIQVKLSDLYHNSDLSRLNEITEKDLMRCEKYKKCIVYLEKQRDCILNKNMDQFSKNMAIFLDENFKKEKGGR